MPGTKIGGLRASKTNKEKYGQDFYRRIGAKGGSNGRTGGYAAFVRCDCKEVPFDHHKAICSGKKGGPVSRRNK